MPSTGDLRDNNMVFIGKNKLCNNGEYCVPMDKFLLKYGNDFYEKKARAKSNKQKREETKQAGIERRVWEANHPEEVLIARAKKRNEILEKKRLRGRNNYHATKHLTVETRRASARKHYNKTISNSVSLEKYRKKEKEKRCRWYARNIAPGVALRKEAMEKIRNELLIKKSEAKRIKCELLASNKAARELAKSLLPKRVFLTDEQRKERKRDDKRNYRHKRRALMKNLEAKATAKQVRGAMEKAKNTCYYCREKHNKLTIDHVIPISSGGGHTLDNIVFACHLCNSKKRDLPANEFGGQFGLLIV